MERKAAEFQRVDWFDAEVRKPRRSTRHPLPSFWAAPAAKRNPRAFWFCLPRPEFESAALRKYAEALLKMPADSRVGARKEWNLIVRKRTGLGFTPACFGPISSLLLSLGREGYFVADAQVLAVNPGATTRTERIDFDPQRPFSMRLRIPLLGASHVQWRMSDGSWATKRFASDGRAYLVNCSVAHRETNLSARTPSVVLVARLAC